MAKQPTDNEPERDTSSYVGLGLSLGSRNRSRVRRSARRGDR